MFNKRWKKVLAWSLSVIIVLAIGGLLAANYAVDKLMTSMAGGLDLESDNPVDPESAIVEPTIAPTETAVAPIANTDDDENESEKDTPLETKAPEKTLIVETENNQAETDKNDNVTSPAATVQPSSSPSNDKLDGYSAQVSADKAKQIQDNVTVKEKADVASIVMSQLSVSDIKRLQELATGGLTIDEKREARSIILGKVSEDQYNELSQIAKKYGVSEGKTQEQVLAEEKALEEGSEQQ